MRRSWIGLFLLLGLLTAGIFSTVAMDKTHEPVAGKLEQAAREALARNWTSAQWFAEDARDSWKQWELLRSGFSDHGPAEEVDALFKALEIYGDTRERIAFAALSRELAEKIRAIGNAHGLVWSNFL